MSTRRALTIALAMATIAATHAPLPAQPTRPAASPPQATAVTLNLSDAAPDAAISAIVKQTSYSISPYSESQWQQAVLPRVSVKLDQVPFWQALREICNKGGVGLYTGYGDRRLLLVPARPGGPYTLLKCPASISGPFVVFLHTLTRNNSVDLSAPQSIQRSLQVQFIALGEPKIRIVQGSQVPQIEQAVDEKGNSLLTQRQGNPRSTMAPARGLMWNMYIPLAPAPASEKIALLRGAAYIIVQTAGEVYEVPNITKASNVTKTAGGYRITLKQLTKAESRYHLDLIIQRDGLDQRQIAQLGNSPWVRLSDERSGQEFPFAGAARNTPSAKPATRPADQVEMRLTFNAREPRRGESPAEPTKFTWEFVTGTQELAVPFEFRDIALP